MSELTKTLVVTNMLKEHLFTSSTSWTCVPRIYPNDPPGTSGWMITSGYAVCRNYVSQVAYLSQGDLSFRANTGYKVRYRVMEEQGVIRGDLNVELYSGTTRVYCTPNPIATSPGAHEFITEELASNADSIRFVLSGGTTENPNLLRLDNVAVSLASQYTTIAAAVDYLGDAGGTVMVEEGIYSLDGQQGQATIEVPSNCTIIGQGNVIIEVNNVYTVFRNKHYNSDGDNRIVISGFKIHLSMGTATYSHDVIYMKNIKYCVFENITIDIFSIHTAPTDEHAAIMIDGDSNHECLGNIISNCKIYNTSTTAANWLRYGIYIKGFSKENFVLNNLVDKFYVHGIYLINSPKNVLSGNVVTNCVGCGIKLNLSDTNTLSDNQVSGNSTIGIYLYDSQNCSVQGNVCVSNSQEGILFEGSSSTGAYYNVISGNVCRGNGTGSVKSGIYLKAYVKYTNVTGNNCYGNGESGIKEENVASVEKNLFVGNLCSGNTGDELVVSSASSISANNLTD